MSDGRYTVGVDIGGTKIAGGVVNDTGGVIARARADTPHRSTTPDVVENTIVSVVEELFAQVGKERVTAVGIGAAGFVAADRATVVFAPHLSWRDEPLQSRLVGRIGLPVTVDNDANASAWAEWRFGSARGEDRMVMVNLGTGIGGGIVLDGRVERGRFGIAGEVPATLFTWPAQPVATPSCVRRDRSSAPGHRWHRTWWPGSVATRQR